MSRRRRSVDVASYVNGGPEPTSLYLRWLVACTEGLIEQHWPNPQQNN